MATLCFYVFLICAIGCVGCLVDEAIERWQR